MEMPLENQHIGLDLMETHIHLDLMEMPAEEAATTCSSRLGLDGEVAEVQCIEEQHIDLDLMEMPAVEQHTDQDLMEMPAEEHIDLDVL